MSLRLWGFLYFRARHVTLSITLVYEDLGPTLVLKTESWLILRWARVKDSTSCLPYNDRTILTSRGHHEVWKGENPPQESALSPLPQSLATWRIEP